MPVALLIALLVLAGAAPDARAKGPEDVGCAWHRGDVDGVPAADRSRDVVRGPVTLIGARLLQRHRMPIARTRHAPLGVMVEAGHEAAIVIAPESRELARLEYVTQRHRLQRDIQMNFWGCGRWGGAPRTEGSALAARSGAAV